jgi:hypothetical protein
MGLCRTGKEERECGSVDMAAARLGEEPPKENSYQSEGNQCREVLRDGSRPQGRSLGAGLAEHKRGPGRHGVGSAGTTSHPEGPRCTEGMSGATARRRKPQETR